MYMLCMRGTKDRFGREGGGRVFDVIAGRWTDRIGFTIEPMDRWRAMSCSFGIAIMIQVVSFCTQR